MPSTTHDPTRADIALNTLAVLVAGVSGILLILIIGRRYGPAALGMFNKVFALYLILSQVAALGVHLSVLKHVTEARTDLKRQKEEITGGLLAVLPSALGVPALLAFAAPAAARLMNSPGMEQGLYAAAGGLFFFSWAKILLAAQNALMRLRAYALYNCLRYVLLVSGVFLHMLLKLDPRLLGLIFPFAEGSLCLLLLVSLGGNPGFGGSFARLAQTAKKHLSFGFRGFGGNLMLDINTRVAVLCLGVFTDDRSVGIYSMAAILAEAAYQMPIVLRTAYNPKIVLLLLEKRHEALLRLVRRLRLRLWLFMGFCAVLGVALYPRLLPLLTGRPEYAEGTAWFAVMMAGVTVASGYAPFGLLLVNGGLPGRQTQMILFVLLLNLAGNLALVPFLGPLGAALSTSLTQVASLVLLKAYARKHMGLGI